MNGQNEIVVEAERLYGDALDSALHDCMSVIWKAYRSGVASFNSVFPVLYHKYSDPVVTRFIECMGIGLASAVNRKEGK